MKKWIVLGCVFAVSLLYCFPAEPLNQNAMFIKILDGVKMLSEKSAQQEKKMNEILGMLSQQRAEHQQQMQAHNSESVRLLKDIKVLLQK